VQNVDQQRRTLLVSVKSNLSKQVFLYADQQHTTPAERIVLAPGAIAQLFAVVRPTLPRELLHGGAVRRLVGGLSFAVEASGGDDVNVGDNNNSSNNDDDDEYDDAVVGKRRTLMRYRLRFRALLGVSVLKITPSSLRHVANVGDVIHGEFQVCSCVYCLDCSHTHTHKLLDRSRESTSANTIRIVGWTSRATGNVAQRSSDRGRRSVWPAGRRG
jgi:hypothetical protein